MYEQLRKQVYKTIYPEGIPLGKDVEVKEIKYKLKIEGEKEIKSSKTYIIYDINYTFDGERYHTDGYVYLENKITYPSIRDRMFGESAFRDHDDIRYEILGKPLQLQDIFRAINNMMVIIDGNGNFYRLEMKLSDKTPRIKEHICKLDLSLPISSQSEETLQKLLELTK